MVEVNPLVISKQKQILALDCKMSFDNNAMFRRDKVSELRDKTQEDEKEVYASDRGLNYVSLDGNIGNIMFLDVFDFYKKKTRAEISRRMVQFS